MTGLLKRIKLYVSLILFYMVGCKDGHLFKLNGYYEGVQKLKKKDIQRQNTRDE
jgi:hypothetical protein